MESVAEEELALTRYSSDLCAKLLVFRHKLLHSFLKRCQHIPYLLFGKPARDVLLAVPVECLDLYDDGAFDDGRSAVG